MTMMKSEYKKEVSHFMRELALGHSGKYLENPAVGFVKEAKAGAFDHLTDEQYETLLAHYEDLSGFWQKQSRATVGKIFEGIMKEAAPNMENLYRISEILADSYESRPGHEKFSSLEACKIDEVVETMIDMQEWETEDELTEQELERNQKPMGREERLLAMKPKEIYDYVSRQVYGQREAVKAASMLVYNHLRGRKRNMMFIGPTGCGKTEIWRVMSSLYPNIKIVDCTQLTMEGWKGSFKLRNIFDDMTVAEAEHAIIVMDEFDKFCEPKMGSNGTDYSAAGQNELLKCIEGTILDYPMEGKNQSERKIDTSKVSFVFCGSFINLMMMKTEESHSLGFGADVDGVSVDAQYEQAILTDDLADFGHVRREICGRINQVVQLSGMTARDYQNILKMPSLSPLTKLEREYDLTLKLDHRTEQLLTEEAELNHMGVRYLYSSLQRLLDEELFEDQDQKEYTLCQRD